MMKKFLTLMLVISLVCLGACGKDEVTKNNDDNDRQNETEQPKTEQENEQQTPEVENQEISEKEPDVELTPSVFIEKIGASLSEGGMYYEDAVRLCEAVVSKDKGAFAEFTFGNDEYYDFLDRANISSYTLYPFEFSQEKIDEYTAANLYLATQDNYIVEFDVTDSNCEEFKVGKCAYYFGLEIDPIAGNMLQVFVPIERAEEKVTVSYDSDYTQMFIKEFTALYLGGLDEGRNYADSFDFSNCSHLITHLMARSPAYGEPPYTLDEVNEFISDSFDGHTGISVSNIDYGAWTSAGKLYGNSGEPDRIFGCSWGHGGTTMVHDIVKTETDGDRKTMTVKTYADYSKVAEAYTLVFYFAGADDDYPCLTMIEKKDDTGRDAVVWSI